MAISTIAVIQSEESLNPVFLAMNVEPPVSVLCESKIS